MSNVTIWHNPRCSKSRQTLQLLQSRGIEPLIVEYLKQPPSIDEIKKALLLLDIDARSLMRKDESTYKEAELGKIEEEAALIAAMAKYPILIERPIVFANNKAAIGRPPQNVLEIL